MTIPQQHMLLDVKSIGELDQDDYIGLIDDTAVECLVVRLRIEALEMPIWVRRNGNRAEKKWSVIAGRHRLRAAQALGWTAIAAEERAGPESSRDELQRLQLVENLDRRVMRPIERALSIMCRWRSVAASNAWDIVSHARDVDHETAKACGVDGRTIRRYRRIFDAIVVPFPDHFALLNAHPLGESLSAMTQLASLKQDARHQQRRAAIDKLLERDDWPNMSNVLEAAGLKESNGNRIHPDNRSAVMTDAWSKMRLNEKRQYLEEFPKILTKPMAVKLVGNLMREFDI
ncbi:hypothetical protein LTR94_025030 [Friedmanniomyces endolithicus]|nr:hypothetical protein LTR94_025030 [Friedmanniomyces endolithicus]